MNKGIINILPQDSFTLLSRLVLDPPASAPKELGLEAHTIFSMMDLSGKVILTDQHESIQDAKTKYATPPFLFSGNRNSVLEIY